MDEKRSSATLQFPSTGTNTGFANAIAKTAPLGEPAAPVRELLQNSMDARVAGTTVHVRFTIRRSPWREIPEFDRLRNTVEKRIQFQRSMQNGQFTPAVKDTIDRMQQGLAETETTVLIVADNGEGISDVGMEWLVGDGAGGKPANAAGAYGLGHQTFLPASNLLYVLYASKRAQGRIAGGQVVLASGDRTIDEDDNGPIGYLRHGVPNNPKRFHEFPRDNTIPKCLTELLDQQCRQNEQGTGAIVLIVAFNDFLNDPVSTAPSIANAAAANFLPAIANGSLTVEVHDQRGGTPPISVNNNSLGEHLNSIGNQTRGKFICGYQASLAYATLCEGKEHTIEFPTPSGIESVSIRIKCLEPSHASRIQLFRNDMYITHNAQGSGIPRMYYKTGQLGECSPFHAIINVNPKTAPELNDWIRSAEGPLHNEINLRRLSEDQARKGLETAFGIIAEKIAALVPKRHSSKNEEVMEVLTIPKIASNSSMGVGGSMAGSLDSGIWQAIDPTPTGGGGRGGSPPPRPPKRRRKKKRRQGNGTEGPKGLQAPHSSKYYTALRKPGTQPNEHIICVSRIGDNNSHCPVQIRLRQDDGEDSSADRMWQTEYACLEHVDVDAGERRDLHEDIGSESKWVGMEITPTQSAEGDFTVTIWTIPDNSTNGLWRIDLTDGEGK